MLDESIGSVSLSQPHHGLDHDSGYDGSGEWENEAHGLEGPACGDGVRVGKSGWMVGRNLSLMDDIQEGRRLRSLILDPWENTGVGFDDT